MMSTDANNHAGAPLRVRDVSMTQPLPSAQRRHAVCQPIFLGNDLFFFAPISGGLLCFAPGPP